MQTAAKTPGNAASIVTDGFLGDMASPEQEGPSCEPGPGFFLLKAVSLCQCCLLFSQALGSRKAP